MWSVSDFFFAQLTPESISAGATYGGVIAVLGIVFAASRWLVKQSREMGAEERQHLLQRATTAERRATTAEDELLLVQGELMRMASRGQAGWDQNAVDRMIDRLTDRTSRRVKEINDADTS